MSEKKKRTCQRMSMEQQVKLQNYLQGLDGSVLATMKIGAIHDQCVADGHDVSKSSVRTMLDAMGLEYKRRNLRTEPDEMQQGQLATLAEAVLLLAAQGGVFFEEDLSNKLFAIATSCLVLNACESSPSND